LLISTIPFLNRKKKVEAFVNPEVRIAATFFSHREFITTKGYFGKIWSKRSKFESKAKKVELFANNN